MRELNLHHAGENQSYISKPPSTINTQKKLLSTAIWAYKNGLGFDRLAISPQILSNMEV